MGQDLCPAGDMKARKSLIWGCPLTDRPTTDTGGASEVWRRGKQLACGRRTETFTDGWCYSPVYPRMGYVPTSAHRG